MRKDVLLFENNAREQQQTPAEGLGDDFEEKPTKNWLGQALAASARRHVAVVGTPIRSRIRFFFGRSERISFSRFSKGQW